MKITKTRLKQILNEEVQAFLQEADQTEKLKRSLKTYQDAFQSHGPRAEQDCDGDQACMNRNNARIKARRIKAQIAKIEASSPSTPKNTKDIDDYLGRVKSGQFQKDIGGGDFGAKADAAEFASRGKRGKKRRAGTKRAALNRTFKKGVMPKGTGYDDVDDAKGFKDFYAALKKAGIKVTQDSHWGRRHYRAWRKLRAAGPIAGGTEISDKTAEMYQTGKGGPNAGASANMAQSRDARMASLARSQTRLSRLIKNSEKQGLDTTKYKKQLVSIQKQMKGVEAETGVDDSKELAQLAKDTRTQANIDSSTNPKRAAASQAKLDKGAEEDVLNPGSKAHKAAAAKKAAGKSQRQKEIAAYEKKQGRKLTPKEIQTLKKTGVI